MVQPPTSFNDIVALVKSCDEYPDVEFCETLCYADAKKEVLSLNYDKDITLFFHRGVLLKMLVDDEELGINYYENPTAFVKDLDALEAKHGSTMNYQIGLQYRFIDKPVPLALVQTVCTFMRIETSFSTKNMQYPSLTLDKMPPPSVQAAYVAVFFDEFYSHADITSRMRYLRDTYVGDGTWSHVMDKYVDAYFTVRIYLHNHGQKFTPYQLPPANVLSAFFKLVSSTWPPSLLFKSIAKRKLEAVKDDDKAVDMYTKLIQLIKSSM